jgi:hypothetical protein
LTQSNVVNIGSSPNDGTGDPLRIAFANINVQFANLFTNYQLSSALSSNVITLTANNTNFVGLVTAANVVSNAQLIANLANYVLTSSLSGQGYQTVAGLPANVATLTANNASYLGGTAAASYALSSTLSNYQTTAGLSANVATVTANNTSFVGSVSAVNVVSNAQLTANLANYTNTAGLSVYQTTAGLSTNVVTLTSNNTNYVGFVAAVNVVSNAQLSANLSLYAALSGSAFTGAVTFSNTISVTGNTRFSNTLLVTGNATFANTITVTGNATFSNTVTVSASGIKFSDGTTMTTASTSGIGTPVALTDAATIALDLSTGSNFTVTLGGNRTLANATNMTVGGSGIIKVKQDGTGSRTLAYQSMYVFDGDTAFTIGTTLNKSSIITYYVVDTTHILLNLVAVNVTAG